MNNRGPKYTVEILAVACPRCKAEPQERCINTSGVIYPTQGHLARAIAVGAIVKSKYDKRS